MFGNLQRSVIFASQMAIATSATAQAARPPAGTAVDETRIVAQLPAQALPCVSIALDSVTIRLATKDLEQMIAARPANWVSETERQAIISAGRAKSLLARSSETPGPDGCGIYQGVLDADSQFAVLERLEKGLATVIDRKTGQAVGGVAIRYWGDRIGPMSGRGQISVSLPGGRGFLVVSWWVS